MTSNRKQLQEVSTREIAATVGNSNGGAFYSINALVEKGLAKLGNFTASNQKNRYAYILTPCGVKKNQLLRQTAKRPQA